MAFVEIGCLDNHGIFRALLDSMARPGTVRMLPGARLGQGASTTIHQLMQSILDPEVSLSVAGDDLEGVEAELRWLIGSPGAGADTADFLLVPSGDSQGQVRQLKRGQLDFPDDGATVVYGVERLAENGDEAAMPMTGPGIRSVVRPRLQGLGDQELKHLKEINSEFPLGVDAIFADDDGRILCIPRSTRLGGPHGVRRG